VTAEATAPAALAPPERARQTVHRVGRVLGAGAVLGLIGQLLFFGVGIGLNLPLGVALALVGGWLTRQPVARISVADAWLGPAAIVFATFAAVRADRSMVTLDVLVALALTAAALVSFSGRPVARASFRAVVGLVVAAAGWSIGGAVAAIGTARRQLRPGAINLDRARPALPILRGILIAVPLVVVFTALFAAADAVFARLIADVLGVRPELGDLPARLATAGVIAWIATGALAMTAVAPSAIDIASPPASHTWKLGTTEAVTVLAVLGGLFAVFVVLQGAYLFGGLDTLAATGIGYAEYARRGFFELVAVAMLAGGVVVTIDRIAHHRTPALVGAAVGLVLMTGVVLASAAYRMRLYQEAFGWTELRLYVLATIVLLGVVLVALIAALATDRVHWIGHVLAGTALVIGLALNVLGPVRFVTEQNVARVIEPGLVPAHGTTGLDVAYLNSLDMDAVPGLLAALPHLDEAEARRVRADLRERLVLLRTDPQTNAWQAWNAGRAAALDLLRDADERGALTRR
jgi:hypothetical protein